MTPSWNPSIARTCACSLAALLGCSTPGDARGPDSGSVGETPSSVGSVGSEDGGADDTGSDADDGGDGPSDDTGAAGELRRLELVGHARDGAPWFHVVQDFADDEAVELAIDPALVSADSCDVWVTAARTLEQWQQDPQLVDVRQAGAQPWVAADAYADTRTVIAAAGELSSDAGIGLGVAYDVVLDCDRDGMLGAADLLDGGDAPGLWRVHDITRVGPLAVTQLEAYAGEFLDQRIFHPSDIGTRGLLPLVVVTHGWSYTHTYYDYIGQHLASYGYVVMLHEADVQDGGPEATLSAATTTLDNLEDLLANQNVIGDGVLDGHLDASRIMLTGHSTGGEAVVRAVTELREGTFTSQNFGLDDIRVVSSMAPVSWHPRGIIDPGDIPYHMFVAGADDDVSGAPEPSYTQCRSIYERATGERALTYIHGAGHGDLLSCCGELFLDTSAPDLIGREETNRVARGYFLALAELYLQGNEAAREFLTRPFAEFHPSGIAANVVVSNEHRTARDGVIVLDDFETNEAPALSSAGAAVSFDVANVAEVLMKDNDGSLAWTGDQPSNGMTEARHMGDTPHAVVFDWSPGGDRFYEQAVPSELADWSGHTELSMRVAQGTRHPETVALAGPLTFTITLRDAAGVTSSFAMDASTAVPAPYARDGFGAGVGWQNEWSTIRVRLDELARGTALELSHVAAVRLEVGASFGSPRGRIGVDDLELLP